MPGEERVKLSTAIKVLPVLYRGRFRPAGTRLHAIGPGRILKIAFSRRNRCEKPYWFRFFGR